MIMFKLILSALGNVLGGIAGWMTQYGSKKNTEARVIDNENKKEDDLNEALKKSDTKEGLDTIRRKLS